MEANKRFENEICQIFGDDEKVLAFSKQWIPFETRKEGIGAGIGAFKTALRNAISGLRAKNNGMLCGKYGTTAPVKTCFDLENVLFYNIGNKPLSGLTAGGIAFSMMGNAEAETLRREHEVPPEFCHTYLYSVKNEDITPSESGLTLAGWKPFPCGKLTGKNAADFWKLFKSEKTDVYPPEPDIKLQSPLCFALFLTITKPKGTLFRVQSVMKPLLDGLICSLHSASEDMGDTSVYAEKLHCDPSYFQTEGVLGEREFLRSYRNNSLKWDPADDRCKKAMIRVQEGENWTISGEVRLFCPYCQSTSVAKILYGMPAMSEEMEKAEAKGAIFIGGCCIEENMPAFRCNRCKKRW